jgi:hypothetical protein
VPFLPLLVLLLLPLFVLVAIPFSLVQRYRLGTSRRLARRWVARVNLLLMIFSCAVFIWTAALTSFWVPHAFSYSLIGMTVGAVLGLLGLSVTRWEETPRGLHYTPNRWLVLFLTVAVSARILYGFARAWNAWGARHETPWLVASGLAGSLAVGAVVVGYYLVYSAGVWRRVTRRLT